MNKDQQKFTDDMPVSYRGNYKRAISGKSPTNAIKAKCLDCTNWQKIEITLCPHSACALHGYRPYRKLKGVKIGQP